MSPIVRRIALLALVVVITTSSLALVFAQKEQQGDTIKIDTQLVTVPVVVSNRSDSYLYDLSKEEFAIYEDGVKQEIAFFGTVREAFHVVLMLDTSLSTQEKLPKIRRAAHEFLEQLQGSDRVKIISFDDTVKEWSDFTGNRAELRQAVNQVNSGKGTKLYDAMKLALNSLRVVKANRKAIVILTDGVDWYSDSSTFDDTLEMLEEAAVIAYPIRYDTRPEVEAMLRNQQAGGVEEIFGNGRVRTDGSTPTTMPGGTRPPERPRNEPVSVPRLPTPQIGIELPPIGRGRYPNDRYPDNRRPDPRDPENNRYPDTRRPPGAPYPDDRSSRFPDDRDRRFPDDPTGRNEPRRRQPSNATDVILDQAYRTGDEYLNRLASKSGGELHRADTLADIPLAFAKIAAELRTQYAIGYYPTNSARDGKYRKIKITTTRKDAVLRAKPGYRAPGSKIESKSR